MTTLLIPALVLICAALALALSWLRWADTRDDTAEMDLVDGATADALSMLVDLTPGPPPTPMEQWALRQIEHDLIGDPDLAALAEIHRRTTET